MFIATEWSEFQGGANVFNKDLVMNCGRQCKGRYAINCAVLEAGESDICLAAEVHVRLISLSAFGIRSFEEKNYAKIISVLGLEENKCDFIVGHDIFTGPIALALAQGINAKSVIFIHSNYAAYKPLQDGADGASSEQKEVLQERIVKAANYVYGVGPLLTSAARDLDGSETKKRKKRIRNFIPGLPSIEHKNLDSDSAFSVVTLGRYSGRNEILKQHHLAVSAYATFASDAIKEKTSKRLTVIGLSNELSERRRQIQKLEELANAADEGIFVLSCREFLPREQAWELLKKSHASMMLSWHEGFGLSGWESIAAGVPLILSEKSGLYEFLESKFGHLGACYWPTLIRGRFDGEVSAGDVNSVSDVLGRMHGKRDKIRMHALRLRKELLRHYTWRKRARVFMRSLSPVIFKFNKKS